MSEYVEAKKQVEAHRHLHRCQNCGVIWGHGNMMAEDVEAHKCPKCGRSEWRHFSGGQAVRRQAVETEKKTPYRDLIIALLSVATLAASIVILVEVIGGFIGSPAPKSGG